MGAVAKEPTKRFVTLLLSPEEHAGMRGLSDDDRARRAAEIVGVPEDALLALLEEADADLVGVAVAGADALPLRRIIAPAVT